MKISAVRGHERASERAGHDNLANGALKNSEWRLLGGGDDNNNKKTKTCLYGRAAARARETLRYAAKCVRVLFNASNVVVHLRALLATIVNAG